MHKTSVYQLITIILQCATIALYGMIILRAYRADQPITPLYWVIIGLLATSTFCSCMVILGRRKES